MMLILLVTSKGMAGVPGAAFLVQVLLMYFGIPEQGLLLVASTVYLIWDALQQM